MLFTLVYAEKDNSLGMSGTSLMRSLIVENGFTLQEGWMERKPVTLTKYIFEKVFFLFYSVHCPSKMKDRVPFLRLNISFAYIFKTERKPLTCQKFTASSY